MSGHGPRGRRGYTVVELIAAVAISVIVAVIGFSGFHIFNKNLPVKTTASQISHLLSTARTYAISGNTYYRFTIDLDNQNYWIDREDDPATLVDEYKPKVISPEKIDPRIRVEGIAYGFNQTVIGTGIQSIRFRPDGSANLDAHLTIYQRSMDPANPKAVFTVRVYGPTGTNEVYPFQRI